VPAIPVPQPLPPIVQPPLFQAPVQVAVPLILPPPANANNPPPPQVPVVNAIPAGAGVAIMAQAAPVPVPGAPIGVAAGGGAAGVNLRQVQLNTSQTPVFYNERNPVRGLITLFLFCFTIVLAVAIHDHSSKAVVKALISTFAFLCYDTFMYWVRMDRMAIGSVLSMCISFLRCGLHQVPYQFVGHRGQRFDNPLHNCTQLSVYNDHMGRSLSLLAANFTHYRNEDFYIEMYDYLWSKRSGNQNSELLMSWLTAEATHTFGERDMNVTLSTVKAVYQRIVATRLEERLAYTPVGHGNYASLSF